MYFFYVNSTFDTLVTKNIIKNYISDTLNFITIEYIKSDILSEYYGFIFFILNKNKMMRK